MSSSNEQIPLPCHVRLNPEHVRLDHRRCSFGVVDVMTEAIGRLRTGEAFACRVGTWGWRFPPNGAIGFHVIERGSGWVLTADDPPVSVSEGDVVLVPNGVEHGLAARAEPLRALPLAPMPPPLAPGGGFVSLSGCYHVAGREVHSALRGLPDVIVASGSADDDGRFRSPAALLADDLSAARPGSDVTRSALVDLLLVQLLRQTGTFAAGGPTTQDPLIAAAVRAIHDNPAAPWSVPRLSAASGLSRTAFTRRFTAEVGMSPMAFITDWRLSCAARLLRESQAPLATIARQVGYATEFTFASAFRREFGTPPGRFRRSVSPPGARGAV
jgi:AraC-like DNA-binding protein